MDEPQQSNILFSKTVKRDKPLALDLNSSYLNMSSKKPAQDYFPKAEDKMQQSMKSLKTRFETKLKMKSTNDFRSNDRYQKAALK